MTSSRTRSIRVAHIIPNGDVGGAQEYLASLAAECSKDGITPIILTADHGPFVERYREAADVLIIPGLNGRVAPIQHLRALMTVRRLLAARKVDIVHGHTSRGLVYAGILRRLLHRPAVVSIHGFNSAHALMSPTGAALATRVKTATASRVDALTVAADAIRDVVVRLGIDGRKVHVVYAGIDAARFHPRSAARAGVLRVGAAGRLLPIKGFRTYLEAACMLLDEGVAADFELYGDGPDEAALRAVVSSRGHASRVAFRPFHSDFSEVLRSWDIAVVPSVVDSFPFVPLEAMATGIPVVASAVGGIPEALTDGTEGTLVPPGDPARLAAALRRLLADEQLRRRMGEAGVARISARFTWRRAAQDYIGLYEHLLRAEGA